MVGSRCVTVEGDDLDEFVNLNSRKLTPELVLIYEEAGLIGGAVELVRKVLCRELRGPLPPAVDIGNGEWVNVYDSVHGNGGYLVVVWPCLVEET